MGAQITVVGLGPGNPGHLPLSVWEVLCKAKRLFLRTERHPVVPWLKEKGISFETFDYLYETGRDFQDVYRRMAETLLGEASGEPLVFAVPGHPLMAEEAVGIVLQEGSRRGLKVDVLPAMSFVDVICSALGLDPGNGLHLVDGLRLDRQEPVPGVANIIFQVYSRLVASDVKLTLMEYYPAAHPVTVIRAAGVPDLERIEEHPLYELDRLDWFDHLTSLYLPPCPGVAGKCHYPLDSLVEVMATLRGGQGCPWDREQTHRSLRPFLLEEAYEVLEAIDQEDMYKLCEELGDLLLQIVFHSQLAREKDFFDINDVVRGITAKMLRRHPHVFGDVSVRNSAEVLANWDQIKAQEEGKERPASLLKEVPRSLPALLQASSVQARAARAGFDWPDYRGALDKVFEELQEVRQALSEGRRAELERELGDLLFAVVNLSRLLGVEAEVALYGAINRFRRRFQHIEERARQCGRDLTSFTLDQLDAWWEEAKKVEQIEKKRNNFHAGRKPGRFSE
ncbi:nucleoside triphosphate pyrophosphohydrolase [Desulfofundulus salinus]|uniref:Nucleoside triphosphate pyrophosphohydrolase n=1 Tax=Desulfofundulus salinus TaxID=2419843 RepID=A0A494X0S7_9FIRM|nr:nucleoside triphosphate pyrophosphohydrolase [Desulfofundulus salinum]RKO68222.1 nucleoside triphosphate pyrophosphohydrolase [Desulfofundulus salinum]